MDRRREGVGGEFPRCVSACPVKPLGRLGRPAGSGCGYNGPVAIVRTRFAPSPTGYLHVGGARTALFCWLHARRHGGRFILRIEDTDRERSTEEAVAGILDGLAWLGLDWDEGPWFQSERIARYREAVESLLASGRAYHCYCSRERLDRVRAGQIARREKPRYDGHCRERGPGRAAPGAEPPAVRFRTPRGGETVFDDLVRGRVAIRNDELDDLVIVRADGMPTYNFSVVVDDLDMAVTHVIRGDDHVNNTPRQIHILRALGGEAPAYAHVPMILGRDGQRLSKRHGAVSVTSFREEGYLPEAVLNHLARLGWSHGDQELFTRDELVRLFDLRGVHRGAASFDTEKLDWLNRHYIKASGAARLGGELERRLAHLGVTAGVGGPAPADVAEALRERAATLREMAEASVYFYRDFDDYDAAAARKHLRPVARAPLAKLRAALENLSPWSAPGIAEAVARVAEEEGIGLGKLGQPVRVAVTGRGVSPPFDVTLALVGRDRTLARLARALDFIRARAAA